MDNIINNNYAELSGVIAKAPYFSHENRGEKYYIVPVAAKRLSGTIDTINTIIRTQMLPPDTTVGTKVHVFGQIRSYNNKTDIGAKLIISLFAREFIQEACEDRNDVLLKGTICKQPNYRTTPLGREICDFMLAVNRKYEKSDYLPCIAWGQKAREIAAMPVGQSITISGRIQSRTYIKLIDNQPVEKTAFEISVIEYE